jgi:hypothetical protein
MPLQSCIVAMKLKLQNNADWKYFSGLSVLAYIVSEKLI